MLDCQANEKPETKKKGSSRKRSSSGHERRDSQGEGEGGAKRRKVDTKRDIEKIDHSEKPTESENDEMSQMRGMHSTFKKGSVHIQMQIFLQII